jgi:hypothetical protein
VIDVGGPWRTLRDLLISVEEAADAVASLDLADLGRCTLGERS